MCNSIQNLIKYLWKKALAQSIRLLILRKKSMTILFMYNAEGTRAPPMILYNYKKVPKKVLKKCPQDWALGLSDIGWMTMETFYEYVTRVFYPWLVKSKIEFSVIVYMDGHASQQLFLLCLSAERRKWNLLYCSFNAYYPATGYIIFPSVQRHLQKKRCS